MSDRKPEPTEAGRSDALRFERASAMRPPRTNARHLGNDSVHGPGKAADSAASHSHDHAHADRAPKRVGSDVASGPPIAAPLKTLQEWFAEVMTNPAGLDAGIDAAATAHAALSEARGEAVDRVMIGNARMGARERLGVYHEAYRARLVECLADDYPAVRNALGEDTFTDVCHLYIAEHPSRGPSLNPYGQHMPAFLRARGDDWAGFAADLALLEWALVETVHAADAPTIDLAHLQTLAPEAWARARLPPAESLHLVRGDYNVNAYYQAFRNDAEPEISLERAPSAVAVYRIGFALWRMNLTPAMAGLLEALMKGATLEEALSGVGEAVSTPEELAEAERQVMDWFRAWVTSGFFARVEPT